LEFKITFLKENKLCEKIIKTDLVIDEYYLESFYRDFAYNCKRELNIQVLIIIPIIDNKFVDKNIYVTDSFRRVGDFDIKVWLENLYPGRKVVYKDNCFRRIV